MSPFFGGARKIDGGFRISGRVDQANRLCHNRKVEDFSNFKTTEGHTRHSGRDPGSIVITVLYALDAESSSA